MCGIQGCSSHGKVEGERVSVGGATSTTVTSTNHSGGKGGQTGIVIESQGVGGAVTNTTQIIDGGGIYDSDGGLDSDGGVNVELCPASRVVPTGCLGAMNEGESKRCNGLDDDCDGEIDEGCTCTLGAVQPCFKGPPGRRGIGGCADGFQNCEGVGEIDGTWGKCQQGIAPNTEICDGLDNDCNGCVDEIVACVPVGECPGPNDPRIPAGRPFTEYLLQGEQFYDGDAKSWSWQIEGGPCDKLGVGQPSFELKNASVRDASFTPKLSGDYTVTLTVITADGSTFKCTWVVHVRGPGLRIEMCYPECTTQDLDLFLKRPGYTTPWYTSPSGFSPSDDQCDWHNCEAVIRGSDTTSGTATRANWGYANSDLSECIGGPQGSAWSSLGYCANPRLDIDNNLVQGTGLPENINVDVPRDGETFRIMVQNFTGLSANPIVNVYCGGQRVATYGAQPSVVTGFTGTSRGANVGAMWRVADVTTRVSANGNVTCDSVPLQDPNGGYRLTFDDPSY